MCPGEPLRKEGRHLWAPSTLQKEGASSQCWLVWSCTCRPHQPKVPFASALRGMQRPTLAAERASPQSGQGASHHTVGPLLSRLAASGWVGGPCRPVAATLAPHLWGENSAKPDIRGINLLHLFLVEICIRLLNGTDWSSQKAIPQFYFKAPCSLRIRFEKEPPLQNRATSYHLLDQH